METNNSSAKNQQYVGKDANDSTNEDQNNQSNSEQNNINRVKNSGDDNSNVYNKGKGTGMSSEAGSSQTEESWQGAGGSNASEAQRKSMGSESDNKNLKGSSNMSNSGTSKKWNNSDSDSD